MHERVRLTAFERIIRYSEALLNYESVRKSKADESQRRVQEMMSGDNATI